MQRGRGKKPTSVAKQRNSEFRRDGGKGRRGWGGSLKPHELTRELLPKTGDDHRQVHKEKGYDVADEDELHERLTEFHFRYFKPGKPISVTFQDIGMQNIEQLRKAFDVYDAVRDSKGRDSRKLTAATAVLLGLKR